jgi:aspartate racemase
MTERTLGVVGGVGPESTADYYRRFIDRWRVRGPANTYPSLLIDSLNSRAALGAMLEGDVEPSVRLFGRAVEHLAAAGRGWRLWRR